jgi:hypothetical protein
MTDSEQPLITILPRGLVDAETRSEKLWSSPFVMAHEYDYSKPKASQALRKKLRRLSIGSKILTTFLNFKVQSPIWEMILS